MAIGDNIKRIRIEKGLTQKQLGELCGMADSAIRRYENGGANPKIETRQKIATALGVPLADLLYNDTGNFEYDVLISQDKELFEMNAVNKSKHKILLEILRLSGFTIEFYGCLEMRDLPSFNLKRQGILAEGEVLPNCAYACEDCDKQKNTYYKVTFNGKSAKLPCLVLSALLNKALDGLIDAFTGSIDHLQNNEYFLQLQKQQEDFLNQISSKSSEKQ